MLPFLPIFQKESIGLVTKITSDSSRRSKSNDKAVESAAGWRRPQVDSCTDANPKVIRTETGIIDPPQRPTVSSIRTSFHTQCRSHFFRSVNGEKARPIDADRTSRTTHWNVCTGAASPLKRSMQYSSSLGVISASFARIERNDRALSGSSEMRLSSVANTSCLSSRCWWFR